MSKRAIAVVFLALAATGCMTQPSVDVFVIGLTPLESTGLEQRMRIDLRVQNAGEAPLSARGMQLELDVNGQPLARGVSNTPFSVPSLGETTTSIVTSTSLFDVVRQAFGLGNSATQSLEYEVSGTIYRDGGFPSSIGFRRSGTIANLTGAPTRRP
jgi:LEA14-like dessication related protein